ncbi:MAG: PfkB family carbohydrate kinase [Capsulimonadaceae bacterium]|nr:PfkB family carbohydrate kinase [Capsulimonadaceae bacterium]
MYNQTSFDIIGVGCSTVDDILYVDAYPEADAKTRVDRQERHCGGLTAVALIAASRFGARCAYAGTLGTDAQSDFIAASLAAEGIDIALAPRRDDAAPIHSRIVVDTTHNTRNIFFAPGEHIGPSETLDETAIRRARVLFIDHYGGEATVRAARIAREANVPVIADIERADAPVFDEILRLTSHLIVSAGFALRLTGARSPEDAAVRLAADGKDVVVVTHGKHGGIAIVNGEPVARAYPAFPVTVVDTTGCGDVFHGAYAAGVAAGFDIDVRLRYASAAAAIKASRTGSKNGIPTLAEVRAFLAV